jgi:hypothetical protein
MGLRSLHSIQDQKRQRCSLLAFADYSLRCIWVSLPLSTTKIVLTVQTTWHSTMASIALRLRQIQMGQQILGASNVVSCVRYLD